MENDAATVQGKVTGIIVPPPEIRAIVDKTAQFVARSGRSFERKIATEATGARFAFLNESDPYHSYYEHKINEFTELAKAPPKPTPEAEQPAQTPAPTAARTAPAPAPVAPEAPTESAEEAAGDVVVEKKAVEAVTAKVAKKIRENVLTPPDEEKFKIKHPHLSALDQEIMYVTAQYTALSGKTFLAGLATREQRNPQFDFLKPTHALFAYFTALVESYALVLSKSEDQLKRIEDGMDRMKVLDRCVHKLEWARQEQEKKDQEAAENDADSVAVSQIDWHDFIVVETITFNDNEETAALAAAQANEAKQSDDEDMDMDMEDDSDDESAKPQIKVVQDYIPLASQPTASSTQSLLTVDGKAVSSADANEHMRILLMNPKWREETQRHKEKQKESSYAAGAAIADSLKRFATKRADIFSSSADEEARLQRERDTPAPSVPGGQDDDEEEEEPTPTETNAPVAPPPGQFVPGVGFVPGGVPAFPPQGMPGFHPGMVPPPSMVPPPVMVPPPGMAPPGMPPMVFPVGAGVPPMFPPGVQGPPGVGPPGTAIGPPGAMGFGPPGMLPPGVDPQADGEPASKRQRTEGSSLLIEEEFAKLHPGNVRLTIKVPHDPENEQWKLNGQTVTVEIDVKATMRALKEKLSAELAGMPANKQQLKIPVGFVKDSLTCAHYNFVNGTVLELSARQRGGRR